MNRSHSVNHRVNLFTTELNRKIAIHEAGHAAAIHFGNQAKRLPPIFFQICIEQSQAGDCSAKIDGGRLIHTLPCSIANAISDFTPAQQQAYQQAFDADIINFLVGPLAEARYVALRDDEPITPRLVNLNALSHYGGAYDLRLADDYLQCFSRDTAQQQHKIAELFSVAFQFVSEHSHWRAITALADYILASGQTILNYADITRVLDHSLLTHPR